MRAYLDTHVALWLGIGAHRKLSRRALAVARKAQLTLSPIVALELDFLYEIGRLRVPARDLIRKLEKEANLEISTLPFVHGVELAMDEKWTRDPFDRMIVAQARLDGLAPLICADELIQANYMRTVW